MSQFELHHGDCLDLMRRLPDASVDLILCDLPYGMTACAWDVPIPLPPLWEQYRRIARGAIVLTAQTPFDKVLGASNLPWLRYEWIWHKSRATGHLNAKLKPMKAHENVLVFYRRAPTYNPQGIVPLAEPKLRKGGVGSENYGKADKASVQEFGNYPRSVLCFKSEGRTVHPTQKPVALMEYMVRTYTNPGDLVLDSCMGSGTTGVACVRSGRRFIGIEREARFLEIARQRIAAAANDNTAAMGAA